MSKGAGHVERAIREWIEQRHGGKTRNSLIAVSYVCSEDIIEAAFGPPPWSKAQERSTLRAMRRIIAGQPCWSRSIGDGHRVIFEFRADNDRTPAERRPTQHLLRRPTDRPTRKAKPQKVHEPILAPRTEGWRQLRWDQAVITSRGGASPDRVTIEYDGRRYQGHEHEDGRIMCREMYSSGTSPFCHERARAKVEAEHEERWRLHDHHDAFLAAYYGRTRPAS